MNKRTKFINLIWDIQRLPPNSWSQVNDFLIEIYELWFIGQKKMHYSQNKIYQAVLNCQMI